MHFDAFVRSFATQRSSALEVGGIRKSHKRNGFLVPFARNPIQIFRNIVNKDFEISCQVLCKILICTPFYILVRSFVRSFAVQGSSAQGQRYLKVPSQALAPFAK